MGAIEESKSPLSPFPFSPLRPRRFPLRIEKSRFVGKPSYPFFDLPTLLAKRASNHSLNLSPIFGKRLNRSSCRSYILVSSDHQRSGLSFLIICHQISCSLLRRSSVSMFNRTETTLSHRNAPKRSMPFPVAVPLQCQSGRATVPGAENTKSPTDEGQTVWH